MLMKKVSFAIALISLSQYASASSEFNFLSDNVFGDASLSFLNGESGEFVYSDGGKLSQLDWKIQNTPIIKMGLTWDAISWLTLNAKGWTTIASAGTLMDDYDWLEPGQHHWSDWSHHPATRLNFANQFDLNMTGWFLTDPSYQLGTMLGYQETRFSWLAKGGYYSYDNGADTGDIPHDQRVIGYQQKFSAPYLGLSGKYIYHDFDITAQFKYSAWGEGKGTDQHYLRNITFKDKVSNQKYYSGLINAGYNINSQARIFTEISWSRFSNDIGNTVISYKDKGESVKEKDSPGMQNYNYIIGAGIQYKF
ncbi:omptin family outer membrane protease [Escherichia coli]|nr:omptin family outer membrane protease [Escherichia coli]